MLLALPQDILDFHVGKYLDTISLLNLNEVLPRNQAIIYRFSKDFIASHHQKTIVQKFKSLLFRYEDNDLSYSLSSPNYLRKRNNLLYRLVQEMSKPINSILLKNEKFKDVLVDKLIEFQATLRYVPLSPKWYLMFQRQCKKSLQFILSL